MINWNIEETLNLICMKIHGHYPIDTCCAKKVSNEFRTNCHPRSILTVLTSPAKIWQNSNHFIRRSPMGSINHQQQLKKIIGWGEGRLDNEHGWPPYRLVVGGAEFTITKNDNRWPPQFDAKTFCNLFGEYRELRPVKNFIAWLVCISIVLA